MLKLPETSEPLKVLAIDPGTSTMGISLLEWQPSSTLYTVAESFTAAIKENDPLYASVTDIHGPRVARLYQLGDILSDTLRRTKPHVVIAESPFLGRFPQSFSALIECIALIRTTLYRYDPFLPLYQVDPPSAKKAVGVVLGKKGTNKNSKEDVRIALSKRRDIAWQVELNALDEHSVDSIAVGLYYLLNLA